MNRVLLAGLEAAGAEVVICHVPVWADAQDKMAGVGAGRLTRAVRLLWAWMGLVARFVKLPPYDVLVVGYVGHFDLFLARFLTLFRPRPVVLNALISLYDTVVVDRGLVAPDTMVARLLHWVDRTAFRMADRILIDTEAHGAHLAAAYGVPEGKFVRVFVGADPAHLPEHPPVAPEGEGITVLYVGTYIALHGVEVILDAAARLAGRDDIRFLMVGRGQELEAMRARAGGLANVTFDDRWVPRKELIDILGKSHVALGVFGAGAKAARVIPCKVFDALAMGRPVISADSPGVRELLTDGTDAVLVPAADGTALANAVAGLADEPERRMAVGRAGLSTFRAQCTAEGIGAALKGALEGVA